MSKKRDAGTIKLVGGRLCLDFVNSVHCYGCTDLGEYLNDYQDLIAWSRHAGTITSAEAGTLAAAAAEHPAMADDAYHRAIELREILYSLFLSAVEGSPPDGNDLAAFNNNLSQTMMRSQIIKTNNGFNWDMTGNKANLDWILNPVIGSAADLLVSKELGKLKMCSDPICGWLFLDISRNRSRRWCDMRDCGNRAKAKRFYQKRKPGRSRPSLPRANPLPVSPKSNLDRHLL